jgi:hypothetical protein
MMFSGFGHWLGRRRHRPAPIASVADVVKADRWFRLPDISFANQN